MTPFEQARRYLTAIPGAVSGSGGHAQTFSAAVVLTNGFCLGESEAMSLMEEYNAKCVPPWSENELRHKVRSAMSTPHDRPAGYLLNSKVQASMPKSGPEVIARAKQAVAAHKARYEARKDAAMPPAMEDSARAFIRTVFKEGEGISMVKARLDDSGSEIPDGEGVVLSREEWLRKLDAHDGDPNGIFRSSDGAGIYVRVNPMKLGGSRDADVTCFRHVLIEFDDISISEQWSLYEQSGVPCAAVIFSGGKSLHAWVRVDAKDRAEYDARVRILYEHFGSYGLDAKNKNPSRLSRLPGCERFGKRQELVGLNIGAESFLHWQSRNEGDSLGELMPVKELMAFKATEDGASLIGRRWICRGGSCLIIGQSGVGKSSICLMVAIYFALGRAWFGVAPARPLRSLFVQAENDWGDMAEMLQGVIKGLNLTPEEIEQVHRNLTIRRNSHATGFEFTQDLQRLIELHSPDLVWVDPLLSFIGDDVSKQVVCSQFLRNWINPILEASGAALMVAHHTNKPPGDAKQRKGWTAVDKAYMGAGSAELVNWSRAVCVLTQDTDGNFDFLFAKRGSRAGALDANLEPSLKLKLRHSTVGICWEQVAEKEDEESDVGRPPEEFDVNGFVSDLLGKGYLTSNQIKKDASKFGGISESTIQRHYLKQIKEMLHYDRKEKRWVSK